MDKMILEPKIFMLDWILHYEHHTSLIPQPQKKIYIGKRLTKLYRKSHLGLIHGGEGGVAKMNACIIIFFFTQKYINIVRLWSYGVPKYYIAFVYPSSFEVLLGIAHAI